MARIETTMSAMSANGGFPEETKGDPVSWSPIKQKRGDVNTLQEDKAATVVENKSCSNDAESTGAPLH